MDIGKIEQLTQHHAYMGAELAKVKAENRRLLEALVDYGEHHGTCMIARCCACRPCNSCSGYEHKVGREWIDRADFKCDCGFNDALRGENGEQTTEPSGRNA
jgi:hypothetical protein